MAVDNFQTENIYHCSEVTQRDINGRGKFLSTGKLNQSENNS